MKVRTGLGQDSHRFEEENPKKCILAGVHFEGHKGLKGNSDADVVLHAITNAISGVTGVNILGKVSDDLCKSGIADSAEYLKVALSHLGNQKVSHLSVSLECLTPKITPMIPAMKSKIAELMGISVEDIGITATTGEGLTDFGKGLGVQGFAIITTVEE